MKKQTILVTGGAGFIGSHLCRRLLQDGHHVLCMDNFYTGSVENVGDLEQDPQFHMVQHDITQPLQVSHKVDQIYNLACPASPVHYQRDPIFTTKTCVLGSLNLLDFALKSGATILQASTSEVYGNPKVHPQPESYWGYVNPNGIRSCYDEGKRCAESLFFDYHRAHRVQIKVARIFNTFGPLMDVNDGRVVSNFITQALQNLPITVYGTGRQTRSFCYVDDLVQALIRFMNSEKNLTGPVNLGNPDEFTVLDLAQKVIAKTGSPSEIVFRDLPLDDPELRRPDITLAVEKLGWSPKIDLDAGLERTIDYFRSKLKMVRKHSL